MSRHLLYIINPISGVRNKISLQQIIEAKTQAAGFEYGVFPSVADGDYHFLHDYIREKNVTDIIIAGGDGTINPAVKDLRKFKLPFGILPCGSGNGLAFSALIPKDIIKALDIVFECKHAYIDAFLVNNQFACMLCGLGFDAQVAHDFANDPNRGLATYIRKTVSNFFSASAYSFNLILAKEQIAIEAFFISVANSNQFGNNFTIAPQASLTDGLLDVVIMTKQNKLSMLLHTVRQVGGFNALQQTKLLNTNAGVLYFQTDKIIIENLTSAPFHLDGDPAETNERLEFSILKNCYRLIMP